MRHQGQLTEWNDERGFGFVKPDQGGSRVFVHIKDFSNRQVRPIGGELLTYEVTVDAQGRSRGTNVAFASVRAASSRSVSMPGPGQVSLVFMAIFLGFVAGAVGIGRLPPLVLIAYGGMSIATFLAYRFDKSAAAYAQWRVSESSLHLLALLCGWPGAMLAQRILRHKTKKRSFQWFFWSTVTLNCSVLVWLLTPSGARVLKWLAGSL
jgi:uncharacterized membrane protein YsdA (DUF1294 family)/cold shock CspA family protein